jgi:DeoR family transcriptional regulator, ulaG and ulaABCDEF operon transcriptional repressor
MLKAERIALILQCLEGRDAVSYDEMLAVIDVSPATLRRDVDSLEESGQLRKVRGGVAAVAEKEGKPLSWYHFSGERARHAAAKEAIARQAVSLVRPDDALILFGGTTVARFAEFLPVSGLSVLTNSLPVAGHLSAHTTNRVFLTGGEVLAQQGILLSPFEDALAHNFAASTFFIGCHGVSDGGVMEEDSLPIHVFRVLRRHAERLVVLVDSSKFGQRRSLTLCRLAEIDTLVTDDGLPDASRAMLADAGVEVLIAQTKATVA